MIGARIGAAAPPPDRLALHHGFIGWVGKEQPIFRRFDRSLQEPGGSRSLPPRRQGAALGAAAVPLALSLCARSRRKFVPTFAISIPVTGSIGNPFYGWMARTNIQISMSRLHSVLIRLVFCILVQTKTLKTKCIAIALSALLHCKNALENS
jgi:hypothetical protein